MSSMKTEASERTRRVHEVLEAYDGRHLLSTKGPNGKVHWWLAGGEVFILQEYPNCGGIEVFAAVTTDNSMDTLIEAMKKRMKH